MQTVVFKAYGRNHVTDPLNVGSPVPKIRQLIFTELSDLVNVDPDNDGGCSRRGGFVKRYAGNVNSMFANDDIFLFHEGNALKQFDPDTYASTFINLWLNATASTAFCDVNGLVVYTDGTVIRKVYEGGDKALAVPTAEFKLEVPPGRCLAVFKQHLLVGQDDGFVVTDPEIVDEMDRRQCYFPLGEPAVEILQVDGGLYVSTDERVYYVEGHGLPQWLQPGAVRVVLETPIIKGTGVTLRASQTGLKEVQGNICMFTTANGICYGIPGGIVICATEGKVEPGEGYVSGTAILRESGDTAHYLAILQDADGDFHGEALNVKTQGAARYAGFGFRSIVRYQGRLFGGNSSGIYELTGDTDDGAAIQASGLSGISDCGTNKIKMCPDARLTLRCEGTLEFDVYVDEKPASTYPVTYAEDREGIHKKRRKLARGVKGGHIQIGWRNIDGCDFYLKEIELDVVASKTRRVR